MKALHEKMSFYICTGKNGMPTDQIDKNLMLIGKENIYQTSLQKQQRQTDRYFELQSRFDTKNKN